MPQAIVAFLDGNNFEDSIRNVISIGGDSDTLACITGSIAEAYSVWLELPERAISTIQVDLFFQIIRVGLPIADFNSDGSFVWVVVKYNESNVISTQQATLQEPNKYPTSSRAYFHNKG